MQNGRRFFSTYVADLPGATVLDIGAAGVSLRSACPASATYTGVDMVAGPGVDVVLEDPYRLPYANESVDVIVSTSCFEHADMFWLLYLEIMRVLRPSGLFYMCAPSNGTYHRFPIDCWRFYPDCGVAFVAWGKRNGMNNAVLESYTSDQHLRENWNDFVAVFIKDKAHAARYPKRILDSISDYSNGLRGPRDEDLPLLQPQRRPEDQRLTGWRLHKRLHYLGWFFKTGHGAWDPEKRWKDRTS